MVELPSCSTCVSLLERLRQRSDRDSWECFARLYTPLLFCWARRLGFSAEDAEDRVQDAFELLLEKLPQFAYNPQKRFRGWLFEVFRNRCWEEVRRRPDAVTAAARVELDALSCSGDEAAWVEAEYHKQVVGRALEVMREKFEERTWRACWEYVARDRPAVEVARELGVSVDVVYGAKRKVLRQLRQELHGLLD